MANKLFEAIHPPVDPTTKPVQYNRYIYAMSKTVEAEQDQLFVSVVVATNKWLMLLSWYIFRRVKVDMLRQSKECVEDLHTDVCESRHLTDLITRQ